MLMSRPISSVALLGVLLTLGACTTPQALQADVTKRYDQQLKTYEAEALPRTAEVSAKPIPVLGTVFERGDPAQEARVDVSNASVVDLVRQLADTMGYGVSVTQDVDVKTLITARFTALSARAAIRQLAWQSGLVAVVSEASRTVTLARTGTVVFRVPPEQLKQSVKTDFKYGGNPVSASATTGVAPTEASFNVAGSYANSPKDFAQFIETLAGDHAAVQIFLDSGLISVRGGGQSIKRVHDFLDRWSYDARRQVEVNARVIEVSLTQDMKYGIDWKRVFNTSLSGALTLKASNLVGLDQAPSSLSVTSANIDAVFKALESLTQVQVTSTPKLVISNHSSGVIFEGVQKPYVPSVTSTTTGVGDSAVTTLSGSAAMASDGVQLSVHATLLSDRDAILTVVPATVSLGAERKFLGNQITVFEQSIRNGGQRVVLQSGQTVVISGNRYTRNNGVDEGLPGTTQSPALAAVGGHSKDGQARQTVILMTANILPPTPYDTIYAESI